jgi:hypothetical protein
MVMNSIRDPAWSALRDDEGLLSAKPSGRLWAHMRQRCAQDLGEPLDPGPLALELWEAGTMAALPHSAAVIARPLIGFRPPPGARLFRDMLAITGCLVAISLYIRDGPAHRFAP